MHLFKPICLKWRVYQETCIRLYKRDFFTILNDPRTFVRLQSNMFAYMYLWKFTCVCVFNFLFVFLRIYLPDSARVCACAVVCIIVCSYVLIFFFQGNKTDGNAFNFCLFNFYELWYLAWIKRAKPRKAVRKWQDKKRRLESEEDWTVADRRRGVRILKEKGR